MTLADCIRLPLGKVLLIGAMLLFTGQIALCLRLLWQQGRSPYLLLSALHVLFGFFFLTFLLDGIFVPAALQSQRSYPRPVLFLYALPWPVIALTELLSAALLLFFLRISLQYQKSHLTLQSIKETVDRLPAGICFQDRMGTVILSNEKMQAYCRALTGNFLINGHRLWNAVVHTGTYQDRVWLVRLPDSSALLFSKEHILIREEPYEQILAFDVTQQYQITASLTEANKRLQDQQLRMKLLAAQNAALVSAQEILNARTAFHDQFSGVLLTAKYYFDHPEQTNEEALLMMVKNTNSLFLRQVEEPDDQSDLLDDAPALCRRIGIDVEFIGPRPEEASQRDLLGHAIIECAANTVKHAEGTVLSVRTRQEEQAFQIQISNNGRVPDRPILESGGLLSLRQMTEALNGQMTVHSRPFFILCLKLPCQQSDAPS